MSILYFSIPLILLFGLLISYEDIKCGKIRNRWIVWMIIASLVLWSFFYFLKIIDLNYMLLLLVFSLASLVIGFFIWVMGIWSAGDAKLYFAFCILMPLPSYASAGFPPLTILINSIVPIFLFLVGKMVIMSSAKRKLIALKNTLNPKKILLFMLIVFSLMWVSNHLFYFVGIAPNYFLNILAIMFFSKVTSQIVTFNLFKKLKIRAVHLFAIVGIFRVIFEYKSILTSFFWIEFITLTMGFALIRMFIWELGGVFSKRVAISDLKEGMILADRVNSQGEKRRIEGFGYSKFEGKRDLFLSDHEGLNKQDITKIKTLYNQGKLKFEAIKIQETLPFAPFIFFGVLITILSKLRFLDILIGFI